MTKTITIAIAPHLKIDERYYEIFEYADNHRYNINIVSVIDDLRKITFPISYQNTAYDLLALAENQAYLNLKETIKPLEEMYYRVNVNISVLTGPAIANIISHLNQTQADILVIDPHNTQKSSNLPHGATHQLMRLSPIPVWVIAKNRHLDRRHTAVAIDLDSNGEANNTENQSLLKFAVDFAQRNFSSLSILHIWHLESEGYLGGWPHYSGTELCTLTQAEHTSRTKRIFELLSSINFEGIDINIDVIDGIPNIKLAEYTHDRKVSTLITGKFENNEHKGSLLGPTTKQALSSISCDLIIFNNRS